jgi:hypothetical protein
VIRHRILALGLATALGFAEAGAATETIREQSAAAIDMSGVRVLRVENPRGRVSARPAGDARLHIVALKVARAPERGQARELAAGTRVESRREGDRYSVKVQYPQRTTVKVDLWDLLRDDLSLPSVEVELALEVPAGVALELVAASGDLETEGLAAPQSLKTASGDIRVTGARGPVEISSSSGDVVAGSSGRLRLRTASGDIEIEQAGGPLEARSTSGTLVVRQAADSLDLACTSGDIEVDRAPRGIKVATTSGEISVRGASGRVAASSSSGDIRLVLVAPLGAVEASSVSGSVGVRLAEGLGAGLDARTSSGTIDAELRMTVRSATRHQLSAVIGPGGPPLTLRSSSGDIEIKTGGDRP